MFTKNEIETKPFIIAEVGQNHQGDIETAMNYIKIFAEAGANAVKFQTRSNKFLFSEDAYNAKYNSDNAFAETYGEHREHLELNVEFLPRLKAQCDEYKVKFMSTPFEEESLKVLVENNVDILKIASFDLGNLPFIKQIAETGIPTVMSIGGGQYQQIESSVHMLEKGIEEISILHCVSEYPCEYDKLGLNNIEMLINKFPKHVIGVSDHFNGTLSGPIAYMKGARVFEKHVTLNRAWKGTDHSFALEPEGFRKFCRDINRVPYMMNPKKADEIGIEPVFKKLGKSLIAKNNILKGDKIRIEDLSGKIFSSQFFPVRRSVEVIGKLAKIDIQAGTPIDPEKHL
jgi:N-acetylneuraminate synthase/sialic acid synthase